MRILFLARYDPTVINTWSGTQFHIHNKLKEKHHVEVIGVEIINQLNSFSRGNLVENRIVIDEDYIITLNRLLSERINNKDVDLLFFGGLFLASFLDIGIPFVHLSDATYEQFNTLYIKKQNEKHHNCFINLEKLMLNNAFKIIYSSNWIKQKAIDFYKIAPNKIHVIEFGANIPAPQNYKIDINTKICNLVFIGKNWKKKGGDKALQAYKRLKSEGFPCTLTIIGSTPNEKLEEDKDLTIIPHLDKSKQEDLERLCNILSESHFLILPTEFDAFGIVFCEASAYGVPSIAADVGGVSQAIKEGKNGFLLPPDATAKDYAEKIKSVFNDKENYIKLRESSRHEFETRLNWDVWGEKVDKVLEGAVREWKTKN